jgi:hypothetical protein
MGDLCVIKKNGNSFGLNSWQKYGCQTHLESGPSKGELNAEPIPHNGKTYITPKVGNLVRVRLWKI